MANFDCEDIEELLKCRCDCDLDEEPEYEDPETKEDPFFDA